MDLVKKVVTRYRDALMARRIASEKISRDLKGLLDRYVDDIERALSKSGFAWTLKHAIRSPDGIQYRFAPKKSDDPQGQVDVFYEMQLDGGLDVNAYWAPLGKNGQLDTGRLEQEGELSLDLEEIQKSVKTVEGLAATIKRKAKAN